MDITLNTPLSLRPERKEDTPFLLSLFQASNPHLLLTCLPEEAAQQLIEHQFQVRQRGYQLTYPDACHYIVTCNQQPIGQLCLHINTENIHIVDLALIPEQQGQGYGSQLLNVLKQHIIPGQSLTLSVSLNNPRAQDLYQRLGFIQTQRTEILQQMQWTPQQPS